MPMARVRERRVEDGKAAERCNVGTDCWTMYAKRKVAEPCEIDDKRSCSRAQLVGICGERGHAEDAVFSADCALAQRPHQQYAHER